MSGREIDNLLEIPAKLEIAIHNLVPLESGISYNEHSNYTNQLNVCS